jgi:heavy metal translocating P-type ATPase
MPDAREPLLSCACGPSEPFNWAAWWRVGLGLLVAANSMTLSVAIDTSEATAAETQAVYRVLLVLAVLSLALLGWPLARNSWLALVRRRITIEAMFLAGLVGATVASLVAMVGGTGEVYFEIVSILLVVYAFGQQLTADVRDRALRSAIAWSPQLTTCSVVCDDGKHREQPVSELRAGQLVFVSPGAAMPVDGVVVEGEAFVREAEMTGEPFHVVRRSGDQVWAGTLCVDASLTVRATSDGQQRRIDHILEAVDRARQLPSTLQAQADRLVERFLPFVVTVACLTWLVWWLLAGWQRALFNAMAVLLVACPCALGLATPLVVWAAMARLASRGLVVRDGDAIEALASVDAAVFDKTGTITEPRVAVIDLAVEPPEGWDRDDVLAAVASVERCSDHPVAWALDGLCPSTAQSPAVQRVEMLPAVGIVGFVREAGRTSRVVVGTADRLAVDLGARWHQLRSRLRPGTGAHQIVALIDGVPAFAALVDERLRATWPDALLQLRELGVTTVVMTGDRAERARLSAADEVLAEVGPEGKRSRVQALRHAGQRVLFVGDGVNDAAAMAAADVSVGVASGADLAIEVGSMTWHGNDLRSIPWAVEIARRAVATIRSNLMIAAGYNLVGISLAALGLLHPVVAALLMTCSSVVVTWRAISGVGELERDPAATADTGPVAGRRLTGEGVAA